MLRQVVGLELDIPGLEDQATPVGHGVPGVDHQVHHHLLELPPVGPHPAQVGIAFEPQLHVLAEDPAEHLLHLREHLAEVEDRHLQHLPPAEGEELAGELGGPGSGPAHLGQVLADGIGLAETVEGEGRVVVDHREEVVEVVGHAPGQAAHRLQALGLAQARLHRPGPCRLVVEGLPEREGLQGPREVAGHLLEEGELVGLAGGVPARVGEEDPEDPVPVGEAHRHAVLVVVGRRHRAPLARVPGAVADHRRPSGERFPGAVGEHAAGGERFEGPGLGTEARGGHQARGSEVVGQEHRSAGEGPGGHQDLAGLLEQARPFGLLADEPVDLADASEHGVEVGHVGLGARPGRAGRQHLEAVAEVLGELGEQGPLVVVEGVGLTGVEGQGAHHLARLADGQGEGRGEAPGQGRLPPGVEGGVGGDEPGADHLPVAHRPPRRPLPPRAGVPGDPELRQIAVVDAGMGHRRHRPLGARRLHPHPGHPVAPPLHGDGAHRLEEGAPVGGAHQRLVALAQGDQRPAGPGQGRLGVTLGGDLPGEDEHPVVKGLEAQVEGGAVAAGEDVGRLQVLDGALVAAPVDRGHHLRVPGLREHLEERAPKEALAGGP